MTVAELSVLAVPPRVPRTRLRRIRRLDRRRMDRRANRSRMGGASEIAASTVPVIDDDMTASLDWELLQHVESVGPLHGLLRWQRSASARYQTVASSSPSAPDRWATYVATRSARLAPIADGRTPQYGARQAPENHVKHDCLVAERAVSSAASASLIFHKVMIAACAPACTRPCPMPSSSLGYRGMTDLHCAAEAGQTLS